MNILCRLVLVTGSLLLFCRSEAQWAMTLGAQGSGVIDIIPFGQSMFAGTGNGVLMSTDAGQQWRSTSLTSRYVNSLILKGEKLFAAVWEGKNGVYLSSNNGSTWVGINTGLPSNVYVNRLATDGYRLFAGTSTHGLFVSSNDGANWQSVGSTSAMIVLAFGFCDSMMFMATTHHGVWRSADHGQSWKAVNNGLPDFGVTTFIVHDSALFAGSLPRGTLHRTTDQGDTWTAVNTVAPTYRMVSSGKKLLVATWGDGVVLSENGGTSFNTMNEGLPTTHVYTVAMTDGYVFAGTELDGIWKRPLSELVTSVDEDQQTVAGTYALCQNYPNPFNPTTTIGYSVGVVSREGLVATRVRLAVYDVLGREVKILMDEKKEAGRYDVTWDASGCASGVYICRMTAGTFVDSRKLILLR